MIPVLTRRSMVSFAYDLSIHENEGPISSGGGSQFVERGMALSFNRTND